jgi:cellulose synthase/poly-beta-1,6-N-acetylglucosamine synthase-like glycosyltransferase
MILVATALIMLYLLVNAPALLMRRAIVPPKVEDESVAVTVILAVRNEEHCVKSVVQNLIEQNYRNKEIIIVNDHSTDGTARELSKFDGIDGIKILHLEEGVVGKKAAIRYGEQIASGTLIVVTDADVVHPQGWLHRIVSCNSGKDQLYGGAVLCQAGEGTFVERIQQIEFAAIARLNAGYSNLYQPISMNAANMAYSRDLVTRLHESDKYDYPGGDDIFKLVTAQRYRIDTVFDSENPVFTAPEKTWSSFVNQRKRWISKARAYPAGFMSGITAIIGAGHIFQVIFLPALFVLSGNFYYVGLWLAKYVIDVLLLSLAAFETRPSPGFISVLRVALVYPYLAVYIGITALTGSYQWKGREYER